MTQSIRSIPLHMIVILSVQDIRIMIEEVAVVAAAKKVLQSHLVKKMRKNSMVKKWRVQLMNSFRLLQMILYEVIVFLSISSCCLRISCLSFRAALLAS